MRFTPSLLAVFFCCCSLFSFSQDFYAVTPAAKKWVRKQFRHLSKDERIAQLMIIRAHSNLGPDHIAQVTELISKYNEEIDRESAYELIEAKLQNAKKEESEADV